MKVAICCIIKQENLYLRDWVKYYYDMGIKNIILYDNNDVDGEYPQQVIGDYISNGFVIYKDVRGGYRCQIQSYTECYSEYKFLFDWIGFLDIDEYWYLSPEYTLDTFFDEKKFPNAGAVFFNWLCYGDNDLVHYDNRPVYERFNGPTVISHVKKIFIKCNPNFNVIFDDANSVLCINENGDAPLAYLSNGKNYNFEEKTVENAFIKHYITLTIEEFLYRRFGRKSYADNSSFNKEFILGIFKGMNKMTEEKQLIIDEFFQKYNMIEDNV